MNQYPDWLGHDLVAGTLPWEQGSASSLATFLDRFTLLDAQWVGLYTEAEHSATLLVQWTPPMLTEPHLLAIRACASCASPASAYP